MTGSYGRRNEEVSLDGFNSQKRQADHLSEFYLRSDKFDLTEQLDEEEQE